MFAVFLSFGFGGGGRIKYTNTDTACIVRLECYPTLT